MKLFFFDIDGTLAEGFDVPESAQKALKQLRNKDHLVFICTGRPVYYVKEHFGQYADGFICFNGRYALLNQDVLYDCPLTEDQVKEITEKLDALKAGYNFFNNEGSYDGGYLEGIYHTFDKSISPLYNFNIWFGGWNHFDRIEEELKDIAILNKHGCAPHADATILGSDKGDAISHVLKKLNVSKEDSYAFGDGSNDISMLKAVGHGIAMGNSVDEVKECAEFITKDLHDDGVAYALKEYGFIK